MDLAAFLLALLAVARVTRFVVSDSLPEPLRDRLVVRYGPDGFLPRLIECPWCTSIWLALPASALAYYCGDQAWFVILTAWLAISYLVAMTAMLLDND